MNKLILQRRGFLRAALIAAPAIIFPRRVDAQLESCLPAFCGASPSCTLITTDTWSTTDKTAGITLSNSDKTANAINTGGGIRSVNSHTTGKWYLELDVNAMNGNIFQNDGIGLCIASTSLGSLYANATALFLRSTDGHVYNGGNAELAALDKLEGQIIGIAYNGDLGLLWVRSESTANLWLGTTLDGSANPVTGAFGLASPFGGNAVFAFMGGDGGTTDIVTINQVPVYAAPAGYCLF